MATTPHGRPGIPSRRLLAAFVLLLAVPAAGARPTGTEVLLGASALDLRIDFDTTMDISGPTRFFSSRQRMYAGGRIATHTVGPQGRLFNLGRMFAFGWGQTGFQMNWETPGVQSYDPLDAKIRHAYLEYGFDARLRLGDVVHLSGLASGKWIYQNLQLEVGGEDFIGHAAKLVGVLGAMATVDLGFARLAGGVARQHFLNDEVEWEVDDLDFDSRHTEPSLEYFLGVVLR